MKCNVGRTDRILRGTAGLGALAAGYCFESWWGLLGLVPLATAVFRFCPAYVPFGFSTCARCAQAEDTPWPP